MKNSRHSMPQVNAGSMADIAFLLLIFFLVTAMIPKDKGINRKLPAPCPPGEICDIKINKRNMLEVRVNSNNELFVENKVIVIEELKAIAKEFVDNNGDKTCDYCHGLNSEKFSDNPKEAVISIQNDKRTSYAFYIEIQDELTKAYYELRSDYAKTIYNKSVNELTKYELSEVKKAYPFLLSEAELK
ncbi:ExbD/TolR family protein [Psychroserpens ponticola]|uniref:Biopolymer transporter ExbD n=1 Tax=Psychroserpens ponticola TaxID=2932268 RepID=A0ABY7S1G9_9FLAO|nr:biopolymer transporter ExbD [Psychroserpens ponticola]WCO03239.1 biopolymer transporter ExbD [Psychroserpens ponticola]